MTRSVREGESFLAFRGDLELAFDQSEGSEDYEENDKWRVDLFHATETMMDMPRR